MNVRILHEVVTEEQYESMSFNEVMEILQEHDEITTEEELLNYAKYLIDQDNIGYAIHILQAVYESECADWYWYDYNMGTLQTPSTLTCKEDVEHFLEVIKC